MNKSCILFDDEARKNLLPLTFTRPVSEIRVGILTIREKWERLLSQSCSHLTRDYLQLKFPKKQDAYNLFLCGSMLPTQELAEAAFSLKPGEALRVNGKLLAVLLGKDQADSFQNTLDFLHIVKSKEYKKEVSFIQYPWDIFSLNGMAIEEDYVLLTKGRSSAGLSKTNRVLGDRLFVEEGAKVECAMINTLQGPVYIGKDAEIMEGSLIRGPFALCEGSVLKMGAKIYGATTIGPHSKIGGEVNNSVIFGYSNKAHDGFLGNSVIGEWCNLGADTNNSNLKNNYAEVRLWNYDQEQFVKTGLQFCGLIMGDHAKTGINTMFNTGSVVGLSANIFGPGFPRNFIPSFSWGGAQGFMVYTLPKALETMKIVMERRGVELTEADHSIYKHIFDCTEKYRKF